MSKARALLRLPGGRRTKWAVLVFWLIVAAVAGPLSGKLMGAEKNDAQSWLPPKAESKQVLTLQSTFQSPNVFPAVVVYDRPSGLTPADRTKALRDVASFAGVPGVVRHHVAGPFGGAADSAKAFSGIDSTLLYATLAVVIVLLLITYRSPALWLLPVITAGIALVSAEALIYLLAVHAGLTVNGQSAGILNVLVFGAGTDYALLLTARYREELRRHEDRHEAMAVALRRAGPAIIASAGTVIVSLLTLTIAELNSTKSLGPVLAIGVLVSLLAMMTLLPALLVIFGRWLFWPVKPAYGTEEPTTKGFWARVGRRIAVRPRMVWVVTALILGAMAVGLTGLKAGGLTAAQGFRHTPDSVVGQTVVDRHFPAGAGQPVIVIGNEPQAAQLASAVKATPGITDVIGPFSRAGHAYLQGTLTTAPDSQAAYNTIDRARAAVHAVPGADALVGGNTAINLDVERASAHDRTVIIPVILLVVFLILGLLLRALIAPIMLIATVVLSFAAALGVSALVFDHVFGFGGADTSFPLFVFVFLVALGIDYNIFLMTRVREEAGKRGPRRGALTGLAATGGVITSAGAVLAGTFAALATLPVTFLAELGFAVAFGVLLDTIVVRSVLVTALNLDLGRHVWWPSSLSRQPAREADAVPDEPTNVA